MSEAEQSDVGEFVRENRALLVRVLAYGDAEGRSYALALLANGGESRDIEEIERLLNELKREKKP
ncbi:hypothetical protein [Halorussus amylolyticus]|uniref:hypothetical protein n=1 Tax=Halorussus amylolyticus TaxID=1126242 RepID=UPI00104ED60A|nr:hypothetical protein [Halorussus amylolyticus]